MSVPSVLEVAGEYSLDGRQQLIFGDRLDQVTTGTLPTTPNPVSFLIFGGDNHHWNVGGIGAFGQLPGRLKAIQTRHYNVHQHNVRQLLTCQGDSIGSIISRQYFMTMLFKHALKRVGLSRRVVYNQNPCHGPPVYFLISKSTTTNRSAEACDHYFT